MVRRHILCWIVLCLAVDHSSISVLSTNITFFNNCNFTVWPGIASNVKSPPFYTTGFELTAGAACTREAPDEWSGRFWARTGCVTDYNGSHFGCQTGNCPSFLSSCSGKVSQNAVTLVQLTLGSSDTYELSIADGFNIPVAIIPSLSSCTNASCSVELNNQTCQAKDSVRSDNDELVACISLGTEADSYCPTASSGPSSGRTYSCSGADYTVKFCPPASTTTQAGTTYAPASGPAYGDETWIAGLTARSSAPTVSAASGFLILLPASVISVFLFHL